MKKHPSMNRTLTELKIDSIHVTQGVRSDMGDLTTLENSIKKIGLLYPVIVDRDNHLIAGERRLQASLNAGLDEIPVVKLDISHDSMIALDIQSDLNLCRQPLSTNELDALIQRKKKAISGKSFRQPTKVLSRVKKMLSGD